jgi:hypothetical protein
MSIFQCTRWRTVDRKLDTILEILQEINTEVKIMSLEMDTLELAVINNTTLDGSIIDLLNGIANQILDIAGDKAKALELAAELNAKSEALAAAIKANTPVIEPPIEG